MTLLAAKVHIRFWSSSYLAHPTPVLNLWYAYAPTIVFRLAYAHFHTGTRHLGRSTGFRFSEWLNILRIHNRHRLGRLGLVAPSYIFANCTRQLGLYVNFEFYALTRHRIPNAYACSMPFIMNPVPSSFDHPTEDSKIHRDIFRVVRFLSYKLCLLIADTRTIRW